ncbi:MAG: cobalamin biosynthesis protein [Alphaproteobacteria bacterium]
MYSSVLLALIDTHLLILLAGYLISLIIGGPLSYYCGRPIVQRLHRLLARVGEKLNQRNIATRVWRGVILTGLLLVSCLALGMAISTSEVAAMLLAIFTGIQYQLWFAFRALRAATHEDDARLQQYAAAMTTPPQTGLDYHGTLRIILAEMAEHFTVLLVGGAFWFALLGPPGWLIYLTLAACARYFPAQEDNWRAFGWASSRLFRLMHIPPSFLAAGILISAALLVPCTAPRAALRAYLRATEAAYLHLTAALLGITLGGPYLRADKAIQAPWIGEGRAQIEPGALLRMLLVYGAALTTFFIILLFIIVL